MARSDRQVSLVDVISRSAGGPEVKSGVAALEAAGTFPPGFLDEVRKARGMQPQGDIGNATTDYLTGMARSMSGADAPILEDLSALLQGIKSRQADTTRRVQAQRAADRSDVSAFGGIGPDVNLEEFGGPGANIQSDLQSLAAQLASTEQGASGPDGAPGIIDEGTEASEGTGDSTTTTTTTTTEATTQSGDLGAMGPDGAPEADEGESKEAYNPYGALLESAMKDVVSLRGEDPNKKTSADYMKEFADATGVKIDGKPDKSHALMAFGLALMQNKAGKGFNVGEMLSAVGAAGEKAMPAFEKAKEQARAERIAAGKYALGEVKAADASRLAQLDAAKKRVQDLMTKTQDYVGKQLLKQQEHALDMDKLRIEKRYDKEIKTIEAGGKQYEVTGTGTYAPLTSMPNIKINTAIRKSDGQEVLTKPLQDVELLSKGYADTLDGISSVDNISSLIEEASKQAAAGVTGQKLFEFIDGRMKALGFSEGLGVGVTVDGKKLGPLAEADAIRRRLIFQYKRFLTQETGNGISNVDIQNLEAAIGNIDFFTNPQEALVKLRETRKLFEASRDALQRQLVRFGDKDLYLAPNQFDKVQQKIGQAALSGIGMGKEALSVSENDDGITVIKLS